MDIKSLTELKYDIKTEMFDLTQPTFFYNTNVPIYEWIVGPDEEMRPDLLFAKIYNIEFEQLEYYLENLDVLLYINDIINPFDIIKDMVILYPSIDDLSKFRYDITSDPKSVDDDTQLLNKLGYVDKRTRTDSNRQQYIENDLSLPPVVLEKPRQSVRVENGRIKIGGL